ncbi:MAG: LamG domain-containing protein [Armatimonadetes bacterium]|nr:LamG domain-containing protein [Armatimonadota bacterium]
MRYAILPVILLLAALPGLAQTPPVATISFDRDFNAQSPGGVVTGTPENKPELAPGKVGQALKCGPKFGHVLYPTKGLLNRESGTVEMWVCALDWKADDGKFHVFFETRGQGALYLYKYWTGVNLLMLTCPDVAGPYASSQAPTDFAPGVWHHVAGTWGPQGVMAYFDGKPAGVAPMGGALPQKLGDTFRIGDEQWQFPRETSSLVDEVRIYDRALTPAHLAAHAKGDLAFTVPLSAATCRLDADVNPVDYTVAARLDTGGADVADDKLTVRLGLVAGGGALPPDGPALPVKGGQAVAKLAFTSRQPGDYDLLAVVTPQGAAPFTLKRPVAIPTTEWLGNNIGLEDKVLPPWTPLQAKGTDLSVWGRTYSLRESALPTQITTAGAQVLSRPISLNLSSDGKPVPWTAQQVKLLSSSPTKAALEANAVADVAGQPVRFRTSIKAEYDGLVVFDITCDQPDALPLDGLTLDLPVKAENAIYRHRYGPTWIPTSGNVPPGEGVVDKTKWVPFAWLGDNDRGLFWFTEDDRAWANGQAENALEIVRQGDEIILRLNLLNKGEKLPADWRFTFGLQATPVKPIPKDWRKWRMTGVLQGDKVTAKQNVQIVWPNPVRKGSLAAFGWPEARDPESFSAEINSLHDQKLLAVPYLCLTWVTDSTPEWQFFRPEWDMGGRDPSIPDAGWKHAFALASPNGKGYQDFIMYRTKQFVDRYGIDGSYHDQTHPYMSNAVPTGVGYTRNGIPVRGTPILGYRELYRRNYALFKGLGKPTFLQAHMSGKVTIPILAYEDSYLDGEHFRGVVKDSYLDVMTLDSFRCEYMGRQWGIMPFFLPEFDEENRPKVEPTRGLMALLMVHDVNVWPIWCNGAVIDEAFKALDDFGWVESEFIPYFDPKPPAATDLKDVYISAYQKADGAVLLVVANLGREDREGQVKVDLARLGLKTATAQSWPDKAALPMPNATLTLPIPGLGYRMVVVRP